MNRSHIMIRASWRVDGVGAGVCLGMCAVAYFMGIRPLLEQHARFAGQKSQLVAERENAAKSTANLLQVKKEQTEVHNWLATHPLQLQTAQHANQRLAALTSLANKAGAQLDEVQPGVVTTGARYDTFAIRLSGLGTYGACASMIHRMRTTFSDMRIASMDLIGKPTEAGSPAKFRLELLWYTIPATRVLTTVETGK